MTGILAIGAYIPRYRLSGKTLAQVWGSGGSGERAVANYDEEQRVRHAAGKWNPGRKVWELRYGQVVVLNLAARIVEEEASAGGYHTCPGEHLRADASAVSTCRCWHPALDASI